MAMKALKPVTRKLHDKESLDAYHVPVEVKDVVTDYYQPQDSSQNTSLMGVSPKKFTLKERIKNAMFQENSTQTNPTSTDKTDTEKNDEDLHTIDPSKIKTVSASKVTMIDPRE